MKRLKIPTAVVVGAGFGGIASALRLRAKGYNVTILDKCNEVGGRAQIYEVDGFKHDAGPTVITAPFLIRELFNLFSKNADDYISFIPLKIWYRFVFYDQKVFDYGGTIERTLQEIAKFEPRDRDNYIKLLEQSKKIYDIGFTKLSFVPFHNFFKMLSVLPQMIRFKAYKSVWSFVSSYLTNDYLRQAFSIQPLLVGGNPFDTTCIYSLIHYLERKHGVYFIRGGTGALVKALKLLMIENNINIKLNANVKSLHVIKGECKGIYLENGEYIQSNIVVSNADPAFLYEKMVSKNNKSLPVKLKSKYSKFSMGLYVLYFGTNKQYKDVAHHTILLGKRYQGLLDDIFNKKILSDDFSSYLHRPTATDSSFAPEGCDSFYVLVPVPNNLSNINWDKEGTLLQEKIIDKLHNTILPDLKTTILSPFFKTPDDFSTTYSSLHGSGFSISPKFTQSAWFRYHNKSECINNLYLCGAGTHPGAGLPGVLSSAKIVENLVPKVNQE